MKLPTNEKFGKIAEGIRPCWGLCPEILVKFSVIGPISPHLHRVGWNLAWSRRLIHAKFHSSRCNVSPLWGEKPQNCLL